MPAQSQQFILPDLLKICNNLSRSATNPYYRQAGEASAAWINSYNVFTDRKRAFFVQGCNELLVSRTYPYAGYEQFRTCCDFVNLLFVIDEVSDDQNGADARATGEVFLNVMRNPNWDNGRPLAKMTREFRARLMMHIGPNCLRRFIKHCEDYVNGVAREAELREQGQVLASVESFMPLRRENSAVRLCFSLIEYAMGIDLPDKVYQDPTFNKAYLASVDLVCWANDVYSYNVEQAKGHSGNNIVTVLMYQHRIGLQEACNFIGTYSEDLVSRYTKARKQMPSWGPVVDAAVHRYFEGAQHWVRGNLDWSFETNRYFGSDHQKIKATRLVTLRPRGQPEDFVDADSDDSRD
ncbi:isoprenoid synthase domain-containing protein [Mycena floridula]|nr:isoprenoid synthase domain-containing protein [Mycena floridula]